MSGQDINGPGLSDGNVKNTLRGLPDGMFAMQYDGIPVRRYQRPHPPFRILYFPGVTIGSIDVDRLARAMPRQYGRVDHGGGTVKRYSEALTSSSTAALHAHGHLWQLGHLQRQRQL